MNVIIRGWIKFRNNIESLKVWGKSLKVWGKKTDVMYKHSLFWHDASQSSTACPREVSDRPKHGARVADGQLCSSVKSGRKTKSRAADKGSGGMR